MLGKNPYFLKISNFGCSNVITTSTSDIEVIKNRLAELSTDLERVQLSGSDAINYYESMDKKPRIMDYMYDMTYKLKQGSDVVVNVRL